MFKTVSISLIAILLLFFLRCTGDGKTPDVQLPSEDTLTTEIVAIDSVSFKGLKFYYPPVASIGLIVGDEPDTSNFYISFCCAAAYTDRSIYWHKGPAEHIHVAGDHIDGGELHKGYPDDTFNTGGFVVYPYPFPEDCHWKIVNRQEFAQRVSSEIKPCAAFQQELLILDREIQSCNRFSDDKPKRYRALCNYNGKLCIVDGTHDHLISSFVDLLYNAGIEDALYLDMGNWDYSWYRHYPDDLDSGLDYAKIINPRPQRYFGSNWLVFHLIN